MMNHGEFFNEHMGINEELVEHLKSEMYEEISEIGELQHVLAQLEGKAMRRMRKVLSLIHI